MFADESGAPLALVEGIRRSAPVTFHVPTRSWFCTPPGTTVMIDLFFWHTEQRRVVHTTDQWKFAMLWFFTGLSYVPIGADNAELLVGVSEQQ